MRTQVYAAPEMATNDGLMTPQRDMFAVGVTLMQLLLGVNVRADGEYWKVEVQQSESGLNAWWGASFGGLVGLLKRCVAEDAAERPTAAEVRESLRLLRH